MVTENILEVVTLVDTIREGKAVGVMVAFEMASEVGVRKVVFEEVKVITKEVVDTSEEEFILLAVTLVRNAELVLLSEVLPMMGVVALQIAKTRTSSSLVLHFLSALSNTIVGRVV